MKCSASSMPRLKKITSEDVHFLPLIKDAGLRTVAVLGTVKNAGKTEVLTHIIAEAAQEGIKLGITSIGRDGEEKDAVFLNPKPPIIAPKGSLVLTYLGFAKEALPQLEIREVVIKSHLQYGTLAIVEAMEDVRLQVAGPSKKSAVGYGVKRLIGHGSDLVLVDGALDRRGAVDPEHIEGLILSTGMALAPQIEEVVEMTYHYVNLLRLPLWRDEVPEKVAYLKEGRWQETGEDLVIGEEEGFVASLPPGTEALYLKGAVTDRLIRALNKNKCFPTIVVDSPFSIFVDKVLMRNYQRRSGGIYVRKHFRLLAVTVNPWSSAKVAKPEQLACAVKERIPEIPVIDVLARIQL